MKGKGLVQVYTGIGKGKTTAAVGLSCRSQGHNLKTCWVQFHKEPSRWNSGEYKILKSIGVEVFNFASKHPHFYKNISVFDVREECLKGIKFIRDIYRNKDCRLLVCDEILVSLSGGFLYEDEILSLIEDKPANLELVLTGRGATRKIIQQADLVSVINKKKHPYDSGVPARKGIEY